MSQRHRRVRAEPSLITLANVMNEETIVLLIILAAMAVGVLLGVLNYRLRLRKARRLLSEWASRQTLVLLAAQPRHIRCGPFGFRASKAQRVFHIPAKTDAERAAAPET